VVLVIVKLIVFSATKPDRSALDVSLARWTAPLIGFEVSSTVMLLEDLCLYCYRPREMAVKIRMETRVNNERLFRPKVHRRLKTSLRRESSCPAWHTIADSGAA
jgi:hypothetical protein